MKQLTNNQNSTEDAACTCDYDNQADCLVFCHKNVHVLTEQAAAIPGSCSQFSCRGWKSGRATSLTT